MTARQVEDALWVVTDAMGQRAVADKNDISARAALARLHRTSKYLHGAAQPHARTIGIRKDLTAKLFCLVHNPWPPEVLTEIRELVEAGADPNVGPVTKLKRWLPLTVAAQFGDLPLTEFLLKKGADVCAPNYRGVSSLMVAAAHGHFDVARLLVNSCPSCVTWRDVHGQNALLWAAARGHLDMVRLCLVKEDVDAMDNVERKTALMLAARAGHTATVEFLLEQGANPNIRDANLVTALMYASAKGHAAIVQRLLVHGAQVNACLQCGRTALCIAQLEGQDHIAGILVHAGGVERIDY